MLHDTWIEAHIQSIQVGLNPSQSSIDPIESGSNLSFPLFTWIPYIAVGSDPLYTHLSTLTSHTP